MEVFARAALPRSLGIWECIGHMRSAAFRLYWCRIGSLHLSISLSESNLHLLLYALYNFECLRQGNVYVMERN